MAVVPVPPLDVRCRVLFRAEQCGICLQNTHIPVMHRDPIHHEMWRHPFHINCLIRATHDRNECPECRQIIHVVALRTLVTMREFFIRTTRDAAGAALLGTGANLLSLSSLYAVSRGISLMNHPSGSISDTMSLIGAYGTITLVKALMIGGIAGMAGILPSARTEPMLLGNVAMSSVVVGGTAAAAGWTLSNFSRNAMHRMARIQCNALKSLSTTLNRETIPDVFSANRLATVAVVFFTTGAAVLAGVGERIGNSIRQRMGCSGMPLSLGVTSAFITTLNLVRTGSIVMGGESYSDLMRAGSRSIGRGLLAGVAAGSAVAGVSSLGLSMLHGI